MGKADEDGGKGNGDDSDAQAEQEAGARDLHDRLPVCRLSGFIIPGFHVQGKHEAERMEGIPAIEAKLTKARSKLLATVEGLDEAEWNWLPREGRWSARLTLAHVGSAHWSHLEVARRLVAGEAADIPGFDLDEWNEARVAERAGWSAERVLADLQAAQQATSAFLAGLDPEELAVRGSHPALGEVSVDQVLRVIALHDNMHRRDILNLLREMSE